MLGRNPKPTHPSEPALGEGDLVEYNIGKGRLLKFTFLFGREFKQLGRFDVLEAGRSCMVGPEISVIF